METAAGPGAVTLEFEVQNREPSTSSLASVPPIVLAWNDLRFSVKVKNGTIKHILKGPSGVVSPGEVLFIMGPSGSGKSTMLDALSDRIKGKVEGSILINGQERSQCHALRHMAAYVQQEDALYSTLTVRESFEVSSRLYTNESGDALRKSVDDKLAMLGLTGAADTKIGGSFVRGISGGQRRRVSIGVELFKQPSLLFLDEPTSGLDSASAFQVMKAIRHLASLGTTVIATIHQPSARLLALSDKLLLLSAGDQLYFGDTQALVPYMTSAHYPVPAHENPSDFVLDLLNADFSGQDTVNDLKNFWNGSAMKQGLTKSLEDNRSTSGQSATNKAAMSEDKGFPTSWFRQFLVLSYRNWLTLLRNPMVLWMRLGMFCGMALFVGTFFYQVDLDDTQERIGGIFFISGFLTFLTVAMLPVFIEERHIFVRERANGAFRVSSWMVSNWIVGIFPTAVSSVASAFCCYFLMGLNEKNERFLFFAFNLFMSVWVAESFMMVVGLLVPIFVAGLLAASCVYGFFMMINFRQHGYHRAQGFFIKKENIPVWWRWATHISLHKYSFSAFMRNEFLDEPSKFYMNGKSSQMFALDGEQILDIFDIELNQWTCVLVLFGMVIMYRMVAWIVLYAKHTGKK